MYKIKDTFKGGLLLAGAAGCNIPIEQGHWIGKRLTQKDCAEWSNPIYETYGYGDTGYIPYAYGNECLSYVSGISFPLPYTYGYLGLYKYGYQLFLEFSAPYAILTYMYAYTGYGGFYGYAYSLIGVYQTTTESYSITHQDEPFLTCRPVRERLVCDTDFGVVEFVQRFGELELGKALNSFH